MIKVIVCGTGHRPEDSEVESAVRSKVRNKLVRTANQDVPQIETFITGMAAGFDLWAGHEALLRGLDIICAVPWLGHESRVEDRELYQTLIDSAKEIVYVTDVKDYPGPWVYQKRNEWMVDNSDAVMAYWSGKETGGTWNCIKYARSKNSKIANIYHDPPF